MMKIFMMILFALVMISKNSIIVFYMSLCFISVFLMFFFFSISLGDYWVELGVYFGGDLYTFYMMMLSFWIVGLMCVTLMCDKLNKMKLFVFIIMLLVLLMFFSVFNLLMFYFFFEVSLVPTFFIVLFWGNNLERLEAGFFLLMYMMFISFPLLIYVMKIYYYSGSLDLSVLSIPGVNIMDLSLGGWEFLIMFGAFFIKLPIYLFHIWLPKAHVEAPVYGSMLLAAVLLKLGGYGLLRLIQMFIGSCQIYKNIFISVSIIGALFSSMLCLTQVDMKSLVAYSSVVHMNFMLAAIFVMSKFSFMGSYVVMISHGLCSSGLFFFVNVFYKRSFSRLISLNKGYISLMPSIGFWWFLLCVSNFSFPLSLNFLGEIMLIMMILNWGGYFFIFFIGLISFFSGAYSLYLFSIVFHGEIYLEGSVDSGAFSEHVLGFLHYVPLIFMFLNLFMFIY